MAFRATSMDRIPSHCQGIIDSLNLEGKIEFVSLNAKYCRIVFNEALSPSEVSSLSAHEYFHKLMDPFADREGAVFFHRFA